MSGGRRGDDGSGSVLLLGVVALALALVVAVSGLGAAVTARHRAQAAADLAALAGADVVLGRAGGDACGRAARVLRAHGALGGCTLEAGGAVRVEARVAVGGPLAALLAGSPARSAARAGAPATPAPRDGAGAP
ncbi:Rv3654c family TadE-like protein [Kineococcus esterisolvens]|uniref:Rv3654c family TadE-like protein n=1 Tax=unclassified Kineococcus TaxID=2621656 RepID=UPI003D7C96F3